jgi:hypothetical protein
VGTLDREQAVNLLKELMSTCISFTNAQAVSIGWDKETDHYFLRAKWMSDKSEKQCLNALTFKYEVQMSEKDGYTEFA